MRFFTLPFLASLVLVRGADRDPAAAAPARVDLAPPRPAEAADEPEAVDEAAPAPALPPPVATPLRETGAPPPADLSYTVREAKGGGLELKLRRKGHLVAMRLGAARTAGEGEATLALSEALPEGGADPVVWETTKLDTLATVRGTLRLPAAGGAEGPSAARDARPGPQALGLHLVEAPVPAGRAEGRLHTCAAHEDGGGGFTVLCSVRARASAASVTGDEAGTDVWVAHRDATSVVRMDLPASPTGFEARVLGYSAGLEGVVLRAEASRAAGEDRPSLTLAAAERAQPQVPRVSVRKYYCCCGF